MMYLEVDPNLLILGGAAIFSLLVCFIIIFIFLYQHRHHRYLREKIELENRFKQEILRTQLETQENTFHQVGEELHDNIGQLLSSTRMLIGITERSLPQVPDTLHIANETLGKAIQDLRMLSKSLNKEWLHQFNVLDNLRAEVDRINITRKVRVILQSPVTSLPLNRESQVMLFRIIQEALHNSIKHAEADLINISMTLSENITVTIHDDGNGFQVQHQEPAGVGLLNMKHRTTLLGGTIHWNSSASGTIVTIIIPVQNEDR
jgi:signal transduction histidine kinase